jgi:phage major head subunit gpT-like protein
MTNGEFHDDGTATETGTVMTGFERTFELGIGAISVNGTELGTLVKSTTTYYGWDEMSTT